MAGCSTQNVSGDYYWSMKRIGLGWGGLGATLGVAAALTASAGVITAGIVFWAVVGGYFVGFSIGYAVEWFSRLHEQNPRTITIKGRVVCAGRNTGYPGFPTFADGDWTFNISRLVVTMPDGLSVEEVRTRPAPDWGESTAHKTLDPDSGDHVLHCEIGSAIGDAVAIGRAVGTVAGAAIGGAIGAAIGCVALGIFTFGIACLVAILIGIAVGAAVGGLAGDLAGWAVGAIIDGANDFDELGEAIEPGCEVSLTGRWVTDASHQHNEIHDIESFQLLECGIGDSKEGLRVAAGVGIARHPTGRDP